MFSTEDVDQFLVLMNDLSTGNASSPAAAQPQRREAKRHADLYDDSDEESARGQQSAAAAASASYQNLRLQLVDVHFHCHFRADNGRFVAFCAFLLNE